MSVLLIAAGIAGYILKGGFNLGVDFQAGLLQEVRFAPEALSMTWTGAGNADISANRADITIGVTGTENQNQLFRFDFSAYPTLEALRSAMAEQVDGLAVNLIAPGEAESAWLVESSQESPRLSASVPFTIHYLPPGLPPIEISAVRAALDPLGTASVQALGEAADRHFMIRLEEEDKAAAAGGEAGAADVAAA